jgi:hypothetical protein
MGRKKTKAELQAELSVRNRAQLSSDAAGIVNNLIRWGGLVAIAYIIYLSVGKLAGQATTASIGLNLLGDLRLSDAFAVIFAGGGIGYGARQKHLRHTTVERLQGRLKELEAHIDAGRSSSHLTTRGETNPRDA